MHPDQIDITTAQVSALLADQFPAWASNPIRAMASSGTVNTLFRIGDALIARFPLRARNPERVRQALEAEAGAARELFGQTPFPTPEPIALGEPGHGYPLPWAVQSWLPGTPATEGDPANSVLFAHDLAAFIRAARSIDTRGRTFDGGRAFAASSRGGDLKAHHAWLDKCFEQSEALFDVPRLRHLWASLRELPREAPDAMTHGDLTPGNVLVSDGRLVGVLDCGGFGPADPALDLVCAWHILEPGPRQALRDDLGCDDLEWERGKAWAFQQAMGAAWYYANSNPEMRRMGRTTIARILAESPGA